MQLNVRMGEECLSASHRAAFGLLCGGGIGISSRIELGLRRSHCSALFRNAEATEECWCGA